MYDNSATEPVATIHEAIAASNDNNIEDNARIDDGAIMYHGQAIEIKDRVNRFCQVDENIWNNPYRATSQKIRSFYHAKDQTFKCTSSNFLLLKSYLSVQRHI